MLSSYKQWTVDWDIEAQMFDDSVDVATSWERFKAAYLQRCTSMLAVEMNFMGFMEDERKREGRIFTRWVELTISMADLYNNPTAQDASGGRSRASSARTGNHSGKHASAVEESISRESFASLKTLESKVADNLAETFGIDLESEAEQIAQERAEKARKRAEKENGSKRAGANEEKKGKKISPEGVLAFISYFTENIVGGRYSVPPELQVPLKALVETLVYRRIHEGVKKYTSPGMSTITMFSVLLLMIMIITIHMYILY
jgi:hypothetical protein